MRVFIQYVMLCLFSFTFNVVWEWAHLALYTGYDALGSGWQLVVRVALGDVMYTLFIVLFIAACEKGLDWMGEARLYEYVSASGMGFFVALFVEYKGLWLHRWSYSHAMPMLPILGVGLSPVLQMMVLVPLSVYIVKKVSDTIF